MYYCKCQDNHINLINQALSLWDLYSKGQKARALEKELCSSEQRQDTFQITY